MAASESRVVRSGWLSKRGEVNTAYQKRWFILRETPTQISYHKDSKSKASGVVRLEDYCLGIDGTRENGLLLIPRPPATRTYYMDAPTKEAQHQWIEAFTEVGVPLRGANKDESAFAIKQGTLKKMGGETKNWKVRFFLLRRGVLFYFENKEAVAAWKPIGAIPLLKTTISEVPEKEHGRANAFQIFHPQRRTYFFQAERDMERKLWIHALELARAEPPNIADFGKMSGWLEEPVSRDKWRRLWFVLEQNVIWNAASPTEFRINNAFDLDGYTMNFIREPTMGKMPITFRHPFQGSYVVYASSVEEQQAWLVQINKSIKAAETIRSLSSKDAEFVGDVRGSWEVAKHDDRHDLAQSEINPLTDMLQEAGSVPLTLSAPARAAPTPPVLTPAKPPTHAFVPAAAPAPVAAAPAPVAAAPAPAPTPAPVPVTAASSAANNDDEEDEFADSDFDFDSDDFDLNDDFDESSDDEHDSSKSSPSPPPPQQHQPQPAVPAPQLLPRPQLPQLPPRPPRALPSALRAELAEALQSADTSSPDAPLSPPSPSPSPPPLSPDSHARAPPPLPDRGAQSPSTPEPDSSVEAQEIARTSSGSGPSEKTTGFPGVRMHTHTNARGSGRLSKRRTGREEKQEAISKMYEEATIKTGVLYKLGGESSAWQRRVFVLKHNYLAYFKTPDDMQPTGVINLKKATVGSSTRREHCFCINKPDRTYFLAARDADEKTDWMNAVQHCVEICMQLDAQQEEQNRAALAGFSSEGGSPVIRQGFMAKKGGNRKNWTVRFFTLKKGFLSYARSEALVDKPLGVIPLANSIIQESDRKPYSLTISTPARTYYIDAKSYNDKEEWIVALKAAST